SSETVFCYKTDSSGELGLCSTGGLCRKSGHSFKAAISAGFHVPGVLREASRTIHDATLVLARRPKQHVRAATLLPDRALHEFTQRLLVPLVWLAAEAAKAKLFAGKHRKLGSLQQSARGGQRMAAPEEVARQDVTGTDGGYRREQHGHDGFPSPAPGLRKELAMRCPELSSDKSGNGQEQQNHPPKDSRAKCGERQRHDQK